MTTTPRDQSVSIRDINRRLITGKPVVAIYALDDGSQEQGRIIRARRQQGILQGKLLGSGRWVALRQVWEA